MRKWSLVILVGLLAFGVWAQTVDIKDLDLSKARISLAGPDRVYITSVYYKGQEISIQLLYDQKAGASFGQPYTAKDKSLPDATDLRYASVKKSGTDGIMVSDVIIGNAAYSGIFRYNPQTVKLELYSLWSVPVPQDPQQQIAVLKKEKRDIEAEVASLKEGQTLTDFPYQMDLGYATMKALGSDGILLSRIVVGNSAFAGVLKYTASGALTVDSVWSVPMPAEDERIDNLMLAKKSFERTLAALSSPQDLPDGMDLNYATLKKMGNDSILIERVVLDGQAYSGVLTFNTDNKLALSKSWTVPMPDESEKISAMQMENKSLKRQIEDALGAASVPAAAASVPQKVQDAVSQALPTGMNLTGATMKQLDDKQILLENITYAGKSYAGILSFRSDNSLAVSQVWTVETKAATAAAAPKRVEIVSQPLPKGMSLTGATLKQVDDTQVLLENINYGGETYSGLLSFRSDNSLAVGQYWKAAPSVTADTAAQQLAIRKLEEQIALASRPQTLPEGLDLRYATVEKQSDNSVLISSVVMGGKAYSGVLNYTADNKLAVGDIWQVAMPGKPVTAAATSAADKQIADLQARIKDLEKQVASASTAPAVAAQVALPGKSAYSGFAGTPLLGDWRLSTQGAAQQNAGLKYAKYAISVSQNQPDILYEFTARAPNAGWVGFGLHFLVSGESTGRGYGFGQSYLVWLTRDPAFYKSESAFVQLYRSYDDVQMLQLASVAVPDQIDSPVKVQVFYNRSTGAIAVSVNGVERLRFVLDDPITQGYKIALRTLGGPVQFTDLSVKTY